jgi:hypothetical protein
MQTTSCTAFNFRPVKNSWKENCQIINTTVGRLNGDSADESNEDNSWTLYGRIYTVSVVFNLFFEKFYMKARAFPRNIESVCISSEHNF